MSTTEPQTKSLIGQSHSNVGLCGTRTLGQIVEDVIRTGTMQVMTPGERNHFNSDFEAAIRPTIEKIRSEQRQAFAKFQNMMLD